MMTSSVVICSGGKLGEWALEYLQENHFFIGADSGACFLIENGVNPDIAIGDFDSVTDKQRILIKNNSKHFISCDPIDKDYTDSEMAFRLALDMKPKSILMIGAVGTRFDHSLANIQMLVLAAENNVQASIIDRTNKISICNGRLEVHKQNYPYISLLPLSNQVSGITLSGFQYPLTDATLKIGQSLGVSNVLLDKTGIVQHTTGHLLVIQSAD